MRNFRKYRTASVRAVAALLGLVLVAGVTTATATAATAAVPMAYSLSTPGGLKAPAQSSSSIILTWNNLSGATRYRVQVSTKADYSNATYYRFSENGAEIRGLPANTTHYFRVRAISESGTTNLSGYSAPVTAKTKAALAPVTKPLKVASFNIKCANCSAAGDLSWADRRGAVVANIKSTMPDVIGVQEASQGWLAGETRDGGLAQFEDLQERLRAAGAAYSLTNTKRNNCVKSTTPTGCVYSNQGASQGTKLYFNTSTVSLVSQGSLLLPKVSSTDGDRYLAWGTFIQKSTGKKFFVGDTHLDPTSGSTHHAMRIKQTQAIVSEIQKRNPERLPVLVTGDFNSHKFTAPTNGPYDVMTGAGYVDPLGNTYAADVPSSSAPAEKTVGAFYDSYNGYSRLAKARNKYGNGTHLDYIFTSKMRVSEWQTVAKVDSAGNFIGTIPSDHNMIQATVQLP
jgi:endonuclease/exonuclease/phosphatase family metal-dependent hydrolase